MAWALVSPASRGIGFHLTRHLLQHTRLPVVATARKDVTAVKDSILKGISNVDDDRLVVLPLDVTDEGTIFRAANEIRSIFPTSKNHLFLSFCLPGTLYPEKSPSQLIHSNIIKTFAVNTIGPLLMIKHFSEFIPRKSLHVSCREESLPSYAIWLNMSARVGSISDNNLGGWYSYRASKAGVNSITKTLDLHLRSRCGDNAIAISYHPGTVKTDFSREFWATVPKGKLFNPEYAVSRLWIVIKNIRLSDRGKFLDWKGEVILP